MKGRTRTTTAPVAHFIPSPCSLPHPIFILTVGEFDPSSAGSKPKKPPHPVIPAATVPYQTVVWQIAWQIVHMTWHDMNSRYSMMRQDEHTHTGKGPAQLCHEAEKISRLLWRGGAAVRGRRTPFCPNDTGSHHRLCHRLS
jgi:hypothetical protein